MEKLVPKLMELVCEDVLVGVYNSQINGQILELQYRTPGRETFKTAIVTTTNPDPGFSVSFYKRCETKWTNQGHSHITKVGHLCETMWREFGGDIGKLIRFFDKYPELKIEII